MTALARGLEGFIDGLRRAGAQPEHRDGLVSYVIETVEGAFAGDTMETAVEAGELNQWPVVPPHWVHFPDAVRFTSTNSQPSQRSGWLKHSRQIARWGNDADPARGWLAHVRSVLAEARS